MNRKCLEGLKTIDVEEFTNYYKTHKNIEVSEKYNITSTGVCEIVQILGIGKSGKRAGNSGKTAANDERILSGSSHPMFGKSQSEESRKLIKEHHYDCSGENNSMFGIHRYGEENPNFGCKGTDEQRKKLSIYRMEHPMNSGFGIKYYGNNIYFDSSGELYYYIYQQEHNINFLYHPTNIYFEGQDKDNITRRYFPDFVFEDKIVEIKGDYFFNDEGILIDPYRGDNESAKNKYQCMIDNNITILKYDDLLEVFDYIDTKYGKDYIKSFKLERG